MFGFWLALIAFYAFVDIVTDGLTLIKLGGLIAFGYLSHIQITKNSEKMGIWDLMTWVALSIITLFVIVIIIASLVEYF